jgi:hypothetical protein
MRPAVLDLRHHSLLRGTMLVTGSVAGAMLLAGWPDDQASLKLLIPTLVAFAGTYETGRCLRHHWSLYHGAVIVLLYMDMMALALILFLFLYPYGHWIM